MGEAVSLAHVGRPYVVGRSLDPSRFDVHLACARRAHPLLDDDGLTLHDLCTIPSERFRKALASGKPIYDAESLDQYVQADIGLLERLRPDVVVGDFRLSLAISARICRVPYATITNSWWSPQKSIRYPMPDWPGARRFGSNVGNLVFQGLRPLFFSWYAHAFNRLRRRYGFRPLKRLPEIYQEADQVLLAELPELAEYYRPLPHHRFVGPLFFTPTCPPPPFDIPEGPVVYVSFGSSGSLTGMSEVLRGLSKLEATVVVATAGRVPKGMIPRGVLCADYLDGTSLSERADLVVSNGGVCGLYQALSAGTPVLAVPSNLDQMLSIQAPVAMGAAACVQPLELNAGRITNVAQGILANDRFRDSAAAMKKRIGQWNIGDHFESLVRELVPGLDRGAAPADRPGHERGLKEAS